MQIWEHDLTTGLRRLRRATPEEEQRRAAEVAAGEQEAIVEQAREAARQADLSPLKLAQIQAALDQIDSDLAALQSGPTNAQVLAIIGRILQRQRAIIKALARLAG